MSWQCENCNGWTADGDKHECIHDVVADLRRKLDVAREALGECLEVLNLSDPGFNRAGIKAPEDDIIGDLCERIGYGAVMDSSSRQWRKRDSIGAFVCGPCVGTVQDTIAQIRAALAELGEKEG